MNPFSVHKGIVAPLDRANVDTDAIIPKQFLKSIKKSGFGPNAFDEWRYLDHGEPDMDNSKRLKNPNFVLNQPRYQTASILLARQNFGCGSSREHAPWALLDYGFRVIIAASFADIFFNNCLKNGLLPICLASDIVDELFDQVSAISGYELEIDLPAQEIKQPNGKTLFFDIDEYRKYCLINGLDEIGLTLQHADKISAYEDSRRKQFPWLFNG